MRKDGNKGDAYSGCPRLKLCLDLLDNLYLNKQKNSKMDQLKKIPTK